MSTADIPNLVATFYFDRRRKGRGKVDPLPLGGELKASCFYVEMVGALLLSLNDLRPLVACRHVFQVVNLPLDAKAPALVRDAGQPVELFS